MNNNSIEDIAGMEMPCECETCGKWFDLNDGWSCYECNTIFCCECMDYGHEKKCLRHRQEG